jgi:hypothetical protein
VADANVRKPDDPDGWLDGKRGVARGIAVALARGGARGRQKETAVLQKQMFKVLAPIEKTDGTTWWMRCGNGFRNKDDSMNLHIYCLPTATKNGEIKLQIRELTEEDLRQSAEKRASYTSRAGTAGGTSAAGSAAHHVQDSIPF